MTTKTAPILVALLAALSACDGTPPNDSALDDPGTTTGTDGPMTGADLIAENTTVSTLTDGTIRFTTTVKNVGTGTANAMHLGVVFDSDALPSPASVDVTVPVDALGAGESTLQTVDIPAPVAGSYSSWLFVDTNNEVAETDEFNNLYGPFDVLVARTSPSTWSYEVVEPTPGYIPRRLDLASVTGHAEPSITIRSNSSPGIRVRSLGTWDNRYPGSASSIFYRHVELPGPTIGYIRSEWRSSDRYWAYVSGNPTFLIDSFYNFQTNPDGWYTGTTISSNETFFLRYGPSTTGLLRKSGGSWAESEQFPYAFERCDMSNDSSNVLQLACVRKQSGGALDLVTSTASFPLYEFSTPAVVATSLAAPYWMATAEQDDVRWLSWLNTGGEVVVANDAASAWQTEVALQGVTPYMQDASFAFGVDASHVPHLVYYNAATGEITHTWQAAGSWESEVLYLEPSPPLIAQHLVFGSDNTLGFAYYAPLANELRYVVQQP